MRSAFPARKVVMTKNMSRLSPSLSRAMREIQRFFPRFTGCAPVLALAAALFSSACGGEGNGSPPVSSPPPPQPTGPGAPAIDETGGIPATARLVWSDEFDVAGLPDTSKWSYDTERNWKVLEAVRAVANEVGSTPSAVSLAWLLAKPQVTSVIFGARSVEQLDANLAGAELKLSANHLEALDKASAFEHGYPYEFIKNTQATW
jgi:hypothetical protein